MAADAPPPSPRPLLGAAALAATLLAALAHAAQLTWLCDDAFISFRYARHFAQGDGLVFNVGEAVEGYTNFLWTLLLGLGMRAGAAPEALAPTLGLLAFAGTLGVLAVAGWRAAPPAGRRLWLPVAAMGFAGLLHARIFATSGLETSLFTLLFTAGGVLAVEARATRGWLALGLVAALATLTRPEGALLVGVALLIAAASGPRRGRAIALTAAPIVALVGPWLVWKLGFYGDLLPNTWHAKAGGGPQWPQGMRHVGLYLRTWPVVGAGLLAAAGLFLRRYRPIERLESGLSGPRPPLVILLLTVPYAVHVMRVGGDFMFARFCLPFTPLLLLAVELVVQRVPRDSGRVVLGLLLAATLALAPRPPELDPVSGDPWFGIVEERAWYPAAWVDEARRQGDIVRAKARGVPLRAVYYGTQAMLMYYAEVPTAIEGHVGLTDHEIARLPPITDARVGHGQKTTPAYLRRRGVDLAFDYRLQQPDDPLTRVDFGEGVTARLLTWRPEVAGALRARGVKIADLPAFLDRYINEMSAFEDDKVSNDYARFRAFYFDHTDDSERAGAFERRIAGGRSPDLPPDPAPDTPADGGVP